jgi:hypothetical protein
VKAPRRVNVVHRQPASWLQLKVVNVAKASDGRSKIPLLVSRQLDPHPPIVKAIADPNQLKLLPHFPKVKRYPFTDQSRTRYRSVPVQLDDANPICPGAEALTAAKRSMSHAMVLELADSTSTGSLLDLPCTSYTPLYTTQYVAEPTAAPSTSTQHNAPKMVLPLPIWHKPSICW